jgi:mRNA interferase RelE/StbE
LIWRLEFDEKIEKDMRRLDKSWQRRILAYLEGLAGLPDPRVRGKSLHGDLAGLWRYRVGDYRVFCEIRDDVLVIRAIKIGHRSSVYD